MRVAAHLSALAGDREARSDRGSVALRPRGLRALGKRLGAVLKHVQEQQQTQAVERSKKAPARRGQRRSASERFREANPAVG